MKALIFFLVFLLLSSFGIWSQDTQFMIKQGLNRLYSPSSANLVVSFGNFTYADKEMGSEFSKYLQDQIGITMQNCTQYSLFARDRLEEILEAQELSLSDLFTENDAVMLGKLKGMKAILSGSFFDSEEQVEVFLDLLDLETGTYMGKTSFNLSKRKIPNTISILPDNYNDALVVLDKLSEIDEGEPTNLTIEAWSKRGDGGTYYEGEELVIHFYANQDCYIKVYHIDVNQEIQLIFPNVYHQDNFIKQQKIYTIPDTSYNFVFELGEPFGTEFIKVVAAETQFADIEKAFASLGQTDEDVITRGLSVKQKQNKLAEVMFSYTILEER